MLRKKWERTFLVTVLAMTMSLTPVSAFGSEAFTDGGEVGQADGSADSFVKEDLPENVFDDGVGTESVSEVPDMTSEPVVSAETELSSDQFVYEGVIYRKDTGRDTCGIVGYTEELPENLILKEYVSDGTKDLFVYSIADKAFQNCTKLKKVSVESAFFEVGKNIFDGCEGLTVECYRYTYIYNDLKDNEKINLIVRERPVNEDGDEEVEVDNVSYWAGFFERPRPYYLAEGLRGAVSVKRGLYGTPVTEFIQAKKDIERVEFPDTIQRIGSFDLCMFRCTMLRELIIPDHITKIDGEFIASDCKNLEYVHTGNGYRRIEASDYSDCPNLKKVEIGTSVEAIDDGAFKNCYSLKELYIPSNVKEISATAFWGIEDSITIIGETDSYAEAYASSMGIKFRSNGKTAETSVLKLNKPVVSGNVIEVSVAGENADIMKYEYRVDEVAEGEPYEGQDVELLIPGTLIAAWEERVQTFETKDTVAKIPYLLEARDYYVRVRGLKMNKTWTIWSPPKKATVKVNTPAQPEIGKVTVNGSTVTVTLENRDKHADAYDYVLGVEPKESSDDGFSQTVPTIKKYELKDKDTTKVTFKNVKKGAYYLSVRGYSKEGNKKYYSIPSKIKKVNVFRPAMVNGLKVTGRTDYSVTCKWESEKIRPDGYVVYVQDSRTGKNIKRVNIKNSSTSVTVKGLEAGQRYKIIVRAYNRVNGRNYYSDYDESQAICFTAPGTPSLKGKAVSGHKVKLNWSGAFAAYENGECSYVIYYRNAKDKSYQRLVKISDGEESFTIKTLKKKNTYYFKMRGIIRDEDGNYATNGAYSNVVKVTVK
ncbi:MAG: leucine-rich repeat protein [Blautia sp.]|nr:leucine-rich repeat protein [Blautia sp.]